MFAGMSLALGTLPAASESEIHIHPVVDHLTWVVGGELTVRMKGPDDADMYELALGSEQVALTRACTFFQLVNKSDRPVTTLYGVAPAFVFELNELGEVVYNDQVVPHKSWDELRKIGWHLEELADLAEIARRREESLKRLSKIS